MTNTRVIRALVALSVAQLFAIVMLAGALTAALNHMTSAVARVAVGRGGL